MEKRKDYYELLGVTRDATTAAIKRAYQRLAKQLDPGPAASRGEEHLLAVQVAYETLTDRERRRRYDETLRAERTFGPLAWSFVRAPAAGVLRRPVQRSTLSGEILLTPDEAVAGGTLPIEVPVAMTCPVCEGTGGPVFDCGRCGGEGAVERRYPVAVRIPAGIRDGSVFQVAVDEPSVASVLLTVHIVPA
jgi:molecular chaperone DnaJ